MNGMLNATFSIETDEGTGDSPQWTETSTGYYPIPEVTQAAVDAVVEWFAASSANGTLKSTIRISVAAVDPGTNAVVIGWRVIEPATRTPRSVTARPRDFRRRTPLGTISFVPAPRTA
jgi:hypothetical protein